MDHGIEVKNHSPYEMNLDQYNLVSFDPVLTKAIRITAKIQKGYSAGILEWKLN